MVLFEESSIGVESDEEKGLSALFPARGGLFRYSHRSRFDRQTRMMRLLFDTEGKLLASGI